MRARQGHHGTGGSAHGMDRPLAHRGDLARPDASSGYFFTSGQADALSG
jgi:hypothetical protein